MTEDSTRREIFLFLHRAGLDAYEYHSGGGLFHVVVDVVNEASGDVLHIATGQADGKLVVGLMGWRSGGSWESEEWTPAASAPLAGKLILQLWNNRDEIARGFREGTIPAVEG